MPETADILARLVKLEATVSDLQTTVAELRRAIPSAAQAAKPELRSRGMLDRPKPGK